MTNMTYAQALEIAINAVAEEEVKEKLTALKAQLAKRGSAKTPTKTQKDNLVIMDRVVEVLNDFHKRVTVTELVNYGVEGINSSQKATALLKKLVDAERVVKTIEGRKTWFSTPEVEAKIEAYKAESAEPAETAE